MLSLRHGQRDLRNDVQGRRKACHNIPIVHVDKGSRAEGVKNKPGFCRSDPYV